MARFLNFCVLVLSQCKVIVLCGVDILIQCEFQICMLQQLFEKK